VIHHELIRTATLSPLSLVRVLFRLLRRAVIPKFNHFLFDSPTNFVTGTFQISRTLHATLLRRR
jgi:hypothetical protein